MRGLLGFILLGLYSFSHGVVITNLDFEVAGGYTTSNGEFIEYTPGSLFVPQARDTFSRTDGSDLGSQYNLGGVTGSYFVAEDVDGLGGSSPATLSFSADITNYTDLGFSMSAAEDDQYFLYVFQYEAWDEDSYVHVDYQIDGGGYQNLLWFESDGTSAPMVDTNFDGIGDGTMVTSTFMDFAATIAGTGSSIDIRVTYNLNSPDIDFAIDNLTVTGTLIPEPETYAAVFGIVGLVMVLWKRRRSKYKPYSL